MHGERRGPYLYNSILQLVYAVNPASVSKIVDSNGEPRVVYHGSAKDFDDFALDVAGRTNETESKLGIWFFECRDYVSNLSNNLAYGDANALQPPLTSSSTPFKGSLTFP